MKYAAVVAALLLLQPSITSAASCPGQRHDVSVHALSVTAAGGRSVPMTLVLPEAKGAYPLLLFSHGAFATPGRYAALLKPLAAHGFMIVAPTHIDSDHFRRSTPPSQDENLETRVEDMRLALGAKGEIKTVIEGLGLAVDRSRIAGIGHSFGALIAQVLGGATVTVPGRGTTLHPGRAELAAVVAFSPPGPIPGFIAADAWSTVAVPSLTITGTADTLPGFVDDWQVHRAAFDAAPRGSRWLWVGEGADHYFGGLFGRLRPASPDAQLKLDHALEVVAAFLRRAFGETACDISPAEGVLLEIDQ